MLRLFKSSPFFFLIRSQDVRHIRNPVTSVNLDSYIKIALPSCVTDCATREQYWNRVLRLPQVLAAGPQYLLKWNFHSLAMNGTRWKY